MIPLRGWKIAIMTTMNDDTALRQHLNKVVCLGGLQEIDTALDAAWKQEVVLVGEAIIDEYVHVSPLGRASKENILVVREEERETFGGGVLAADVMARQLCKEVYTYTSQFPMAFDEPHGRVNGYGWLPSIRKERYIDQTFGHKLFEVYHQDGAEVADEDRMRSDTLMRLEDLGKRGVVIITDFGHGMIDSSMASALVRAAPWVAVNTQANAGNMGFNLISKYFFKPGHRRPALVIVDEPEARLALVDQHSSLAQLAGNLLGRSSAEVVIITGGSKGAAVTWHESDGYIHDVITCPALTGDNHPVRDTMGAGDAFLVTASILLRAGLHPVITTFMGNIVGALKCKMVGHRDTITREQIMEMAKELLG